MKIALYLCLATVLTYGSAIACLYSKLFSSDDVSNEPLTIRHANFLSEHKNQTLLLLDDSQSILASDCLSKGGHINSDTQQGQSDQSCRLHDLAANDIYSKTPLLP